MRSMWSSTFETSLIRLFVSVFEYMTLGRVDLMVSFVFLQHCRKNLSFLNLKGLIANHMRNVMHLSFRRFFIDFSWEKKKLSNEILLLKSSQQNRRDITGKRTIDKELFFQANKNSYSTYSYFDSSARIEQFRTFDASQLREFQENYWNWQ